MFIFRKNRHFYEKIGKKGEAVCIDDEIPFDIPESWEWIKLGYLISIITGTSYKKGDITSEGIRILRGGNIQNTEILFSNDDVFLPDSYYNELKEIRKGDVIIVASTGSKKVIGKPGFVKKDYSNISIGAFLRICRPHIAYLSEYIQFIFGSEYYKKHIRKLSQGTNINNVKKEYIENLLIPLPPLNEQYRIIDEFNKIYPLIEEYGVTEEKLTQLNKDFPSKLKSSILQEAIHGKLVPQDPNDEPASVLLEKIREEKERLIKEKKIKKNNKESFIYKKNNHFYEIGKNRDSICIDDKIPFDIPDNWEWTRIKNIVTKLTDGAHKTPNYVDKGIPFLSVKDMSSGYLDFSDTKYISQEDFEKIYQRCNYEYGDILLTKVGTTGIPIVIDTNKDFGLFVSVALLKFNHDFIYNEFLVHLINSPLVQFQCLENTKGVGNKNWVLRDIGNTLISFPPLNEQKRIVEKLERIFQKLNDYY